MRPRWLLPVLLAALVGSCAATWLQFKSAPLDGSEPEAVTGLYRVPETEGRHAAIVMLPDCDGISPHERRWGRDLTEAGFVTYVIDSHFTRQVADGCAEPLAEETLLADALGAIQRLGEQESVDPTRLAVIGWGRGGDVALRLLASQDALPGTDGVRLAIAFYPTCAAAGSLRRPAILVLPELYPDALTCGNYAISQEESGDARVSVIAPQGVDAGFDCLACLEGEDEVTAAIKGKPAMEVRDALIEDLWGYLALQPQP